MTCRKQSASKGVEVSSVCPSHLSADLISSRVDGDSLIQQTFNIGVRMSKLLHRASLPWNHRLLTLLLPAALCYGTLSGLRWPLPYTVSHMVIDYHFGFGKRGLVGAILHVVDHPPYHYSTLVSVAFASFAIWLGILFRAAILSMRMDSGVTVAFLAFFLSAGFASLVCDIGRGEHFGILMTMPCLFLSTSAAGLVLRALLMVVAILVQESNFLIAVPIIAFDLLLAKEGSTRLSLFAAMATVLLPPTVLTWFLGNIKIACDGVSAVNYFQHLAADFVFQSVPAATLCMSGKENFNLVSRAIWHVPAEAMALPLALLVSLPSTLFNLALISTALQGRQIARSASFIATFAPVCLLIVASDIVRFTTLTQLTSLIILVATTRRLGLPFGGTLPAPIRQPVIIMTMIAFELGASVTLTDGSQMDKFPFMELLKKTVSISLGHV